MRPSVISATLLAAASLALAQDTPSIRGVVSDPSGAPVAGARIVLGDSGGNAKLRVSSKDGGFEIAGLAPGTYSLTVRAGIDTATYENENVVVESARATEIDVQLKTAALTPGSGSPFAPPVCFPGFHGPGWQIASWPDSWDWKPKPVPANTQAPSK